MLLQLQAAGDLLGRYAGVWRAAWQHRAALDGPRRLPHEHEFLPAALALQETPVSPAPRVAMWALIAFAGGAVAWATYGRVDVVATAQGRVVPDGRVKTVQPLEAAAVTAIRVADGQSVRAGQVLVELDATGAHADSLRLGSDVWGASLQVRRAEAFLRAMDGVPLSLVRDAGVPDHHVRDEERLLRSEWAEYRSKQERADAEVARSQAALRTTIADVAKLERSLPLVQQVADDYRVLRDRQLASKHEYIEREQVRVAQEGELATQQARVEEIRAALAAAEQQRAALRTEAMRVQMDRILEGRQHAGANVQELAKAQQRERAMTLTAPVDGTVQQLAVHTVGGVVTPAQPLLVIVPTAASVEVEATVENQDVGFVRPGLEAAVKIATFPYTKYGTLRGTVVSVSDDAVNDEKRGLIYLARVRLDRPSIQVDGHPVRITPGMAVTVEVKTGRRRVVEYFLTPLLQHAQESLRER